MWAVALAASLEYPAIVSIKQYQIVLYTNHYAKLPASMPLLSVPFLWPSF